MSQIHNRGKTQNVIYMYITGKITIVTRIMKNSCDILVKYANKV